MDKTLAIILYVLLILVYYIVMGLIMGYKAKMTREMWMMFTYGGAMILLSIYAFIGKDCSEPMAYMVTLMAFVLAYSMFLYAQLKGDFDNLGDGGLIKIGGHFFHWFLVLCVLGVMITSE